MSPFTRLSLLLLAPLAALAAESSSATPRAPTAQAPAADGDTIELSPFVVNVEKDKGYAATTTLSGTRLATDLRDTAGSLSIMTPELMADLNVNSIAEAVLFFPSGNEDFGSPIGGGTQAGNNGMANPGTRKIRGISTIAASRNFFPVAGQVDLYNSERLTGANGPNSILFGTSGVEGVTVTTTKQARTDRTLFNASAKADSNGSLRGALDFNWAAHAKFALRLNALSADDQGFRDDELADTDDFGVFGTPGQMRVVRWALQRPRTYTLSVDVKF
jgi:outer membrane receptor for monomeric catechols